MKKKLILSILVLALACAAVGGIYGYSYYSKYVDADTVYPGVRVEGIDLGGMTQEAAEKTLSDYAASVAKETVVLRADGGSSAKEKTVKLKKLGLSADTEEAAAEAWNAGREGNLLRRILAIREIAKKGRDLSLHFQVDEEKTEKVLKKKCESFCSQKQDASLSREDGEFVVTAETDGVTVDAAENAKRLAEEIADDGWDRNGLTFTVECTRDPATHTAEELSAVGDVLGTFTTSYRKSSWGRCQNIENGTSRIDGTLLYPGESVSVYELVSPFDAENGYELAGSYLNGKTVQTYGGGICQVSTTLYNAVLRAELNVTERSNHSLTVSYVELSEDAAISGTEKDLKFENNLEYPVYIEGTAGNYSVTFTIYGKEYRSPNREISFESECISSKAPSQKEVKDSSLTVGTRKVEETGHTGYKARLWKIVTEDGVETERVQVNSSSYMATQTVVRVGTKKKASSTKKTAKKNKKNKKTKKSAAKKTKKKK